MKKIFKKKKTYRSLQKPWSLEPGAWSLELTRVARLTIPTRKIYRVSFFLKVCRFLEKCFWEQRGIMLSEKLWHTKKHCLVTGLKDTQVPPKLSAIRNHVKSGAKIDFFFFYFWYNHTVGGVRRVIVSVGQNQKNVFLQTDILVDI